MIIQMNEKDNPKIDWLHRQPLRNSRTDTKRKDPLNDMGSRVCALDDMRSEELVKPTIAPSTGNAGNGA